MATGSWRGWVRRRRGGAQPGHTSCACVGRWIRGDRLVFLDGQGKLAALFLLELVLSWKCCCVSTHGLRVGYRVPALPTAFRLPAMDSAHCQRQAGFTYKWDEDGHSQKERDYADEEAIAGPHRGRTMQQLQGRDDDWDRSWGCLESLLPAQPGR